MREFKDKVAVVTGAATGIGRALAIELAGRGARLACCDRADLQETAAALDALDAEVLAVQADVSDRRAMADFRERVLDRFDQVDLLINNAGIALGERAFADLSADDFDKITGVNYWGVIQTSQLFYHDLLSRPESALVNMSSAQGLLAVPYLVPYCTTKFAVRGFTEALRVEHQLRDIEHMTVHCVHPGAVATDITLHADYQGANSAKFHRNLQKGTSPERAAVLILDGVARNRGRIFVSDGAWNDRLARWMPNSYHHVVRFVGRLNKVRFT